jgi:hypothetical protein
MLLTGEGNSLGWTSWPAFRDEAHGLVRKGTDVLRSGKFRLLQISIFPPFDNPQSWEVLLSLDLRNLFVPSLDSYSVIRRTWRFDADYPDIDDPNYAGPDVDEPGYESFVLGTLPDRPTIEVATIDVASSVEPIMRELTELSIPPYGSACELPEDSVSYEVSLGSWCSESQFSWVADGPPAWNELVQATNRILVPLREAFRSSGLD